MQQLTAFLNKRSRTLILLTGFALVIVLGLLDYLTGREVSFSIFYLIPIALVTWYAGQWYGAAACALSLIVWFIADPTAASLYSHPLIHYWNTAVLLGFFLVFCLVLSRLQAALRNERVLARTDPLSQVANARHFYEFAERELDRARRYNHPLTIAYLDLDDFKAVNDRFGHSAGDAVLQSVGSTIQSCIRASDMVARLGGDEFAIILVELEPEGALQALRRIRASLLETMQNHEWAVTCSVGAVTLLNPCCSVQEIIRMADTLMYQVKGSGKGRVEHQVVDGAVQQ